jgi:hypothetical protein
MVDLLGRVLDLLQLVSDLFIDVDHVFALLFKLPDLVLIFQFVAFHQLQRHRSPIAVLTVAIRYLWKVEL